jgi:acyl carrier protein
MGLPALSINWGPWADVGMAAEGNGSDSRTSLLPLDPEEGIRILDQLLGTEKAQVAVLPWDRSKKSGSPGGFSSDPGSEPRSARPRGPIEGSVADVRQRLAAMDPNESQDLLVEQIRHEAGEVLGGAPLSVAGESVSLQSLGLDSLMAIELRNRLHRVLGVNLPMVAFLAGTTIAEIARRLLDALHTSPEEWEEGEL